MNMSNWDDLKKLNEKAYLFLKEFNPAEYSDGRYNITEDVYVNIDSYSTACRQERNFEAHVNYIDVQYMISGRELITVCPLSELECIIPYDEDKDIAFYRNEPKGIDILLDEKTFVIVRPDEAHMPCICINEKENVRKAVIKIRVR